MIVYDTDLSALFIWDGAQWINSTIDTNTDTDDQTIDEFQLNGDDLELSLQDDAEAAKTVDLSKYLDNTDSQELSLTTNTLSISGGTATVDLSGYLDNTDTQDLQLSSNILSLTNDATTVDLSGYLDNTDAQTLNLSNGSLSISGGNTIDLSVLQDGTGTDSQNLTSATLDNNQLTIAIENGNSVSVDLSAILTPLQDEDEKYSPTG